VEERKSSGGGVKGEGLGEGRRGDCVLEKPNSKKVWVYRPFDKH